MIIYKGIKTNKNISFIKFSNSENKSTIEIPIDRNTANLISLHLSKISNAELKIVERSNDEISDIE